MIGLGLLGTILMILAFCAIGAGADDRRDAGAALEVGEVYIL